MELERIVHNINWEEIHSHTSADFDSDSLFGEEPKEYNGFKKSLKTLDAGLFKRSKLYRILNDAFDEDINFSLERDGVFEVTSGSNKIGTLTFSDVGYEVNYLGLIGPEQEATSSHCAKDVDTDETPFALNDIYSMAVLHFNLKKLGKISDFKTQEKILDVFDSSREISAFYANDLVNLAKIAENVGTETFSEIVTGLGEYIASDWAVYSLYQVTSPENYFGSHFDLENLDWDLLVKVATLPDRIQGSQMNLKNPVEVNHPELNEDDSPAFTPLEIILNLNDLKDMPSEIRNRSIEIFRNFLERDFYKQTFYQGFSYFMKQRLNLDNEVILSGYLDFIEGLTKYENSKIEPILTALYNNPRTINIIKSLSEEFEPETHQEKIDECLSLLTSHDFANKLIFLDENLSFNYESPTDKLDYIIACIQSAVRDPDISEDDPINYPDKILRFIGEAKKYGPNVTRTLLSCLYSDRRTMEANDFLQQYVTSEDVNISIKATDLFKALGEKSKNKDEKWNFVLGKLRSTDKGLSEEDLDYLIIKCKFINKGFEGLIGNDGEGISSIRRVLSEQLGAKYAGGKLVELPYYDLFGLTIATGQVINEFDKNVNYLMGQAIKYGSIPNFLRKDPNASRVIGMLEDHGYDPSFFVSSGTLINFSKRTDGHARRWEDSLKSLVSLYTGENGEDPKVSIHKFSPKTALRAISESYPAALRGDKDAAKKVVNYFLSEVNKRIEKIGRTPALEEVTDRFDGLLGQIDGINLELSEHIEARIWERNVPECFYDNHRLSCCVFFPKGAEKYSIPLMTMDPQTSIIEYWVGGMDEFAGVSTLFAGKNKTLLMDTWEAGEAVYSVLSSKQTRKFALDSIVLATDRAIVGPSEDKTLIIHNCTYGRPLELVAYVRELSSRSDSIRFEEKRHFELVDGNGIALKNSQSERETHGSGAFRSKKMIGHIPVFAVNVGMYKQEFLPNVRKKAA
ncbi:hypothetical protein CMO93_00640 [Candidatus Woesearchaeota archaeon]|nr:hypothetical protein [Candidatus Woesearchaeota archaeon]|tara:strand:- start:19083 stop:21986 length:2904 start_codon:yes stop_codon:yes gene_type:complete